MLSGLRVERRLLREQPLQRRDDKGRRFSSAGIGARDEIVIGERERNHRGLDRTCIDPAQIARALEQPDVQSERRERHRRRVDVDRLERGSRASSLGCMDVSGFVRTASAAAPPAPRAARFGMPIGCVRVQILVFLASARGK